MRSDSNKPRLGNERLSALAIAVLLALGTAAYAPHWYVHELTRRYEQADGPVWTAQVQKAWGNVLDPLWEANRGAIQRLGETLGLDGVSALTLPMRLRRISAWLTGETVDSRDAVTSGPDTIPLVYGAPPSLIDRIRERDPYLRTRAGWRLLSTMAGFEDRKALDDTYYDAASKTPASQARNNPYARDGFRTYSFFALVRYAILRYEFGTHEARQWYENALCADGGADWRYDPAQAEAALKKAGHTSPPCLGSGLRAHLAGYRPPPTFAEQVARDPQLPGQLWGTAAKRFEIDVFVPMLVLAYIITYPLLRVVRRRAG